MPVLDMDLPSRVALVWAVITVALVVLSTLSILTIVIMVVEVAQADAARVRAWVRGIWGREWSSSE